MRRSRVHGIAAILILTAGAIAAGARGQSGKPATPRSVSANGADLSYVSQGTGAPVVFVHGAVADLRFWEPQRTAFAKQHRFVAYTFRYHGTGTWPDQGASYNGQTHAADLAAFITSLKAGPVHLVGLSYGGLIAAMAALKEPQLIRTLTLAEPALFSLMAESPDGKAALDEWNKGAGPLVAAVKSGDNAAAVRQLSALVTGDSPEHFDKLPPALRQGLLDNARTLPLLFAAPPENVTCAMLGTIKAPTLLVRGERTPQFFVKTNEIAGRCISGSKSIVVPKASHASPYDNPAAFNREVLAFIAQHRGDTARKPERR